MIYFTIHKCIRFYLIVLFISTIPFISLSQNIKCPNKNSKEYKCGEINDEILSYLKNKKYVIETNFILKLDTKFKKPKDEKRALEIIKLCNKVLNDSDFWNALENYDSYKYAVWLNKNEKRMISGKQIVNCLINGNPDDSSRPENKVINLNIKLYGLGFRFPFFEKALAKEIGDGFIYNKRWFFRKHSINSIGANWIHEFSHSQGLFHCYYCDENRDYSIPYVINRIFLEVAEKYN